MMVTAVERQYCESSRALEQCSRGSHVEFTFQADAVIQSGLAEGVYKIHELVPVPASDVSHVSHASHYKYPHSLTTTNTTPDPHMTSHGSCLWDVINRARDFVILDGLAGTPRVVCLHV